MKTSTTLKTAGAAVAGLALAAVAAAPAAAAPTPVGALLGALPVEQATAAVPGMPQTLSATRTALDASTSQVPFLNGKAAPGKDAPPVRVGEGNRLTTPGGRAHTLPAPARRTAPKHPQHRQADPVPVVHDAKTLPAQDGEARPQGRDKAGSGGGQVVDRRGELGRTDHITGARPVRGGAQGQGAAAPKTTDMGGHWQGNKLPLENLVRLLADIHPGGGAS
ncbi:hypothetical protein GCM10027168_34990 [Streptomyces capparidis]